MSDNVSQISVESLTVPSNSEGRISQLPLDILTVPSHVEARVSQFVVEILIGSESRRNRFGPEIQCV